MTKRSYDYVQPKDVKGKIFLTCFPGRNGEKISFDEIYKQKLSVMDMTAFTLCKENNLPISVFNVNKAGNLLKLIQGYNIGTQVYM